MMIFATLSINLLILRNFAACLFDNCDFSKENAWRFKSYPRKRIWVLFCNCVLNIFKRSSSCCWTMFGASLKFFDVCEKANKVHAGSLRKQNFWVLLKIETSDLKICD